MVEDLNRRTRVLRINISTEHDLRAWAKLFRVTAEHLMRAVAAVGTEADVVEHYLYKDTEPASRTLPHEDPYER